MPADHACAAQTSAPAIVSATSLSRPPRLVPRTIAATWKGTASSRADNASQRTASAAVVRLMLVVQFLKRGATR